MIRIYHTNRIKNNRVKEIDYLRGFLIILMIIDHLFFDFGYFIFDISDFSLTNDSFSDFVRFCDFYLSNDIRLTTRIFVVMLFFFISGISFQFSNNNIKRGIILFSIGVLLSLGSLLFSYIVKEDFVIICSIFFTFGAAILIVDFLYFILYKIIKNHTISSLFLITIGLIIVIYSTIFIDQLKIPFIDNISSIEDFINVIIGTRFYGLDDIPLLINLGAMLIGFGIGKIIYCTRKSLFRSFNKYLFVKPALTLKEINPRKYNLYNVRYFLLLPLKSVLKIIEFNGKHSLYVYIFHQFILLGILFLVLLIRGNSIILW